MSIREYFQRADRRLKYVTLVFELVLVAFLAAITRGWLVIILIGIAVAGALSLALRSSYLCPRCGVKLANLRSQELKGRPGKHPRFWDDWNACPKCGVSFDEELPHRYSEWGPIS